MTWRVSLTAHATAYKTYNTLVNKPWQDKQSVVGDTRGESVDTRYSRSQHQLWSHKQTLNKSSLCIYITRLDSQPTSIRDTDVDRTLTPYLWINIELRVHTTKEIFFTAIHCVEFLTLLLTLQEFHYIEMNVPNLRNWSQQSVQEYFLLWLKFSKISSYELRLKLSY